MMRGSRFLAALLPVVGLAALWLQSDRTYNSGTEWEVPIEGYDPRDYLRGHYVEFSYDWPGIDELNSGLSRQLCLEGAPPRLDRVRITASGAPCPHPLQGGASSVYGWEALSRGRLYIGQARAEQLQRQLQNRDQRGIVTIRQRADGSFTPIAIRFRPLTPAEIAERDAQNEGAEDLRPPPPIMAQ
jgi:hypothetical protein